MKLMMCFLLLIPFKLFAQERGIKFETKLTWEEIKRKANAENKYIFIDCYASWCGPCKRMDKEVYSNDSVGKFINQHFICVRLQMDTTKSDDELIVKWYSDAHFIITKYKVNAVPTYLFFSPNNQMVHRDLGFKTVEDFLKLATAAIDTSKQYTALMNDYLQGKKNYSVMPFLASTATNLKEKDLANRIIMDYKVNFLDKSSDSALCTKENLMLCNSFPQIALSDGSHGRFFKLFYFDGARVDKIVDYKGYSAWFVDGIIRKEEIDSQLYSSGKRREIKPNWQQMESSIQRKYPKVNSDRLILDAQIRWYRESKQWSECFKYLTKKVDDYGVNSLGIYADYELRDMVLLHSDDKKLLSKAMRWLELYMKNDGQISNPRWNTSYSVYGAFLYKLGRTEEGIYWIKKQVKLVKQQFDTNRNDTFFRNFYQQKLELLNKMEKGEKIDETWNAHIMD